jgi:uncharacterized membrane protein
MSRHLQQRLRRLITHTNIIAREIRRVIIRRDKEINLIYFNGQQVRSFWRIRYCRMNFGDVLPNIR